MSSDERGSTVSVIEDADADSTDNTPTIERLPRRRDSKGNLIGAALARVVEEQSVNDASRRQFCKKQIAVSPTQKAMNATVAAYPRRHGSKGNVIGDAVAGLIEAMEEHTGEEDVCKTRMTIEQQPSSAFEALAVQHGDNTSPDERGSNASVIEDRDGDSIENTPTIERIPRRRDSKGNLIGAALARVVEERAVNEPSSRQFCKKQVAISPKRKVMNAAAATYPRRQGSKGNVIGDAVAGLIEAMEEPIADDDVGKTQIIMTQEHGSSFEALAVQLGDNMSSVEQGSKALAIEDADADSSENTPTIERLPRRRDSKGNLIGAALARAVEERAVNEASNRQFCKKQVAISPKRKAMNSTFASYPRRQGSKGNVIGDAVAGLIEAMEEHAAEDDDCKSQTLSAQESASAFEALAAVGEERIPLDAKLPIKKGSKGNLLGEAITSCATRPSNNATVIASHHKEEQLPKRKGSKGNVIGQAVASLIAHPSGNITDHAIPSMVVDPDAHPALQRVDLPKRRGSKGNLIGQAVANLAAYPSHDISQIEEPPIGNFDEHLRTKKGSKGNILAQAMTNLIANPGENIGLVEDLPKSLQKEELPMKKGSKGNMIGHTIANLIAHPRENLG